MANTYNYNGEMLRPSAILKHYPNIGIATMRNWLRACDAISDVKEQLDTRYQKLYATGIRAKQNSYMCTMVNFLLREVLLRRSELLLQQCMSG